jgi:hypothetical protein
MGEAEPSTQNIPRGHFKGADIPLSLQSFPKGQITGMED